MSRSRDSHHLLLAFLLLAYARLLPLLLLLLHLLPLVLREKHLHLHLRLAALALTSARLILSAISSRLARGIKLPWRTYSPTAQTPWNRLELQPQIVSPSRQRHVRFAFLAAYFKLHGFSSIIVSSEVAFPPESASDKGLTESLTHRSHSHPRHSSTFRPSAAQDLAQYHQPEPSRLIPLNTAR